MKSNGQKEFMNSIARKRTTIIVIATIMSVIIIILSFYSYKAKLYKYHVNYDINISPLNVVYSPESDEGWVNTELSLEVEGKDLDSIIVSCSKDIIKRNNLSEVNAYFIKYTKMQKSVYDRNFKEIEANDDFLGCTRDEKYVTFMSLIGNSCTINYNEQENLDYGLTISGNSNNKDQFVIKEMILDVTINYLDGTVQTDKIKIDASDDALSGINAHLL